MRRPKPHTWTRVLAAFSLSAAAAAMADPPPATKAPARAPVIGTHQINRYAAIERLQAALRDKPNALADWIILGELAHEVGVDLAPDQAAQYFKISREAYEKALALAPDKPGLKAAVQFARDYEAGSGRFAAIRDRATQSYLDARRRDLAATDYVPSVRVYPAIPAPAPRVLIPGDPGAVVSPAPTNTTSTDVANFGTRQIYTSPPVLYQPFAPDQGAPYTYQQYSSAYSAPGLDTDAGAVPVTLQRYAIQNRLDLNQRPVNPAYTAPAGTPPR